MDSKAYLPKIHGSRNLKSLKKLREKCKILCILSLHFCHSPLSCLSLFLILHSPRMLFLLHKSCQLLSSKFCFLFIIFLFKIVSNTSRKQPRLNSFTIATTSCFFLHTYINKRNSNEINSRKIHLKMIFSKKKCFFGF